MRKYDPNIDSISDIVQEVFQSRCTRRLQDYVASSYGQWLLEQGRILPVLEDDLMNFFEFIGLPLRYTQGELESLCDALVDRGVKLGQIHEGPTED